MPLEPYETIDLGDITPIELPYLIGGQQYLLLEPSVEQANNYRNWIISKVNFKDGKPNDVRPDMAEVESLLVSQQLVRVEGSMRTLVSHEEIKKWPSRITKQLFAKLKEIGELDEEPDDPK